MTISTSRNKIWRGTDWCSMHLVWYYVIYHIKKRCSNVLRLMSCGTHPYCVYERWNKLQGIAGLFFFSMFSCNFRVNPNKKRRKTQEIIQYFWFWGQYSDKQKIAKGGLLSFFLNIFVTFAICADNKKYVNPQRKWPKKNSKYVWSFFGAHSVKQNRKGQFICFFITVAAYNLPCPDNKKCVNPNENG